MARFGSACVVVVTAAAVWTGGAGPALAQGDPPPPGRMMELGDEELTGRAHRPEAFYVLHHAPLNYARLDAETTFIPELVESVEAEALKAEP